MTPAATVYDSREAWLEGRQTGIGASDSASILGLNPWKSAYQLWAEKTGLIEPEDLSDNEAVKWGIRLEPTIIQAFAEDYTRNVEPWPQHCIVRHPAHPWMTCTPDAEEVSCTERWPVQVKTTSQWNEAEWEDNSAPIYYQVQLQHEMEVLGASKGTLVVLIGAHRLLCRDYKRNERFLDSMIPKLSQFWDCVQTKTPPPHDDTCPLQVARVLAKLHPDDSGETVILPDDAAEWTVALEALKQDLKQRESEKVSLENKIKEALGSATYGMLPDGSRWSWKTQTRKEYTVAEAKFRVLRKVK